MKRYLIIANLILVAGIAYFGVQAVYRLAALPLDAGMRPAAMGHPLQPTPEDALKPLRFYQVIADRNLFNTRPQAATPRKEAFDLQGLAPTALKLKLRGTVTGEEGQACAVIEDEQKKLQRLYRQGDQVQGAVIRMILREKVVLTVNGKDEVLGMEKPAATAAAPAPATQPEVDTPSGRMTLQSNDILAALGDLYSLAQQATIRPNFNQGKRDGFLLARVQPKSVFSQLGLRTGDIIKSVNGKPITSVGQALNLYQDLSPGSQIDVHISRAGTDQTLQFAIE